MKGFTCKDCEEWKDKGSFIYKKPGYPRGKWQKCKSCWIEDKLCMINATYKKKRGK